MPFKTILLLILLCTISHSTVIAQRPLTYSNKSNPHMAGISAEWDCGECHSTEAVNALIHPMYNLNTSGSQMSIPGTFPLVGGKEMSCLTCHIVTKKQYRSNKAFLRGGPYRKELDFCYNCHSRENYNKVNPHQQLSEDGSINSSVCLNCHAKQPSATDHPTIATEMHTDMKATCNKCHALHSHEQNHYGRNLMGSRQATLSQYKATEKRYNIRLPLSKDNEIQCHTCHYIHGSLGIDAVVYEGSEENQYFLRLPKEKLCYACHNL